MTRPRATHEAGDESCGCKECDWLRRGRVEAQLRRVEEEQWHVATERLRRHLDERLGREVMGEAVLCGCLAGLFWMPEYAPLIVGALAASRAALWLSRRGA